MVAARGVCIRMVLSRSRNLPRERMRMTKLDVRGHHLVGVEDGLARNPILGVGRFVFAERFGMTIEEHGVHPIRSEALHRLLRSVSERVEPPVDRAGNTIDRLPV